MLAHAVEEFVRMSLPPPPARVLDVGAGEGELAAVLVDAGYDVVAIDPAGEGEVVPVALADLDEPDASFDAAVAVVSLHHVEPFAPSCRRLAEVVRPGGALIVDEFDVGRFDEASAQWLLDRWRETGRERDRAPAEMVAELRAHLHPLDTIRARLGRWFELGPVARASYLYRWYLGEELREAEEGLIAAGSLPQLGARFAGTRTG
ncbi:MAG TPA: class I SAM-dependent methyltransferase [Gaiellales bacterium]|nr:class I SAM-dependent methyltransferase [Gaiellales bacterium]